MKRLLLAALIIALGIPAVEAQSKKRKRQAAPKAEGKRETAKSGAFDFYLLSLSYAPNFCAQPGQHDAEECAPGKLLGFVAHGLWPQGNEGRGPENCGSSAVPPDTISDALKYLPSEALINHEWKTHGTCSGLSVKDYFAAVKRAREGVSIPQYLRSPSLKRDMAPSEIVRSFIQSNASYPTDSFRVACITSTRELQEVRVCLDKNLSPISCPRSVGSCQTASIILLPAK